MVYESYTVLGLNLLAYFVLVFIVFGLFYWLFKAPTKTHASMHQLYQKYYVFEGALVDKLALEKGLDLKKIQLESEVEDSSRFRRKIESLVINKYLDEGKK